jgi:nitronate monooxygenase
MSIQTALTKRLGLIHPIFQAPLAGGGDTPALVAAVCEAGGLGFIGAAYLTPEQIDVSANEVRARTSRPFGINLFAPVPMPEPPADPQPALERVAPFFAELGLPPPTVPAPARDLFNEQLAAALESGASVFSFTVGMMSNSVIESIKACGMFLIGTATTVEEAIALEKAGVDAIVTQGSEAGGHRATFAADFDAGLVGTISLVPQVVDAVSIPVIASGGIMDGRGIAAALALGATAVQLGTAFLTCDEAGVPEAYKKAILKAREHETRLTRAFSGRPARGIVNRFMTEVERGDAADAILPFPLQNQLTRPLRNAAAKQGRAEFLSLWAGQGVRLAQRRTAAQLVERLTIDTETAIRKLPAVHRGRGK